MEDMKVKKVVKEEYEKDVEEKKKEKTKYEIGKWSEMFRRLMKRRIKVEETVEFQ